MTPTSFLLPAEIARVLKYLRQHKRYRNTRRNLAIFRLACCCGLRRKEIAGLNMKDVLTVGPRPSIMVRAAITKGQVGKRKNRTVPLWWDTGTLKDLIAWKAYRVKMGAGPNDPFVCTMRVDCAGQRMLLDCISQQWQSAIRVLGRDRVRQLSVHKGRHTCASHLLSAGVPVAVVRDSLGHSNMSITDIYLHALPVDHITDVFGTHALVK